MTNKQAIYHTERIIAALHRVEHLLYSAANFDSDSENIAYDWGTEWSRLTAELDEIGKDACGKLDELEIAEDSNQ